MIGAPGHVIRKNGRIVELPERATKVFRWLVGIALSGPVFMMLIGLGDPRGALPMWAALLLSILPFGLAITILVGILRRGMGGCVAYAFALTLMHYLALGRTIEPYSEGLAEMFAMRGAWVLGTVAILLFLREDLHYNLRPFWYSLQAMKEFQEMLMAARMKKEAKKRGETFSPEKVMDAEAVVRAVQAKTGKDIPPQYAGINVKPGFRQQPKQKSRDSSSTGRRKRK